MHEQLSFVLSQLRGAWRFRWPAMAAAWAVSLGGWLFVSGLPDLYESSTKIFVDSSSQLRRILGDQIVEPDVNAELKFVTEAMLGSVLLERVVRTSGLAVQASRPEELPMLVDRIRSRITLEITGGDRNRAGNIYTIKYLDPDGATASRVVQAMLDTFVEDTVGAHREGSDDARSFLVGQIEEVEERLAVSEQRLADFKREHADVLPGREGGYFQRLQAETLSLENLQRSLAQAQSRRNRILAQLRGEGQPGEDATALLPNNIDERIREGELNLESLLLNFTDKHPDVVKQRETLVRLRAQREELLASLDTGASIRPSDPVYQALQISRNDVEQEIAALSVEVQAGQQRVGRLRALMDEVPEVEAELARLDRDYGVVNALYQNLVQKLETEQLSRRVVETDPAEFRVIEPPTSSGAPVEPNRPLLILGALGGGLAAGVVVALALSQLWPAFPNSKTLRDVMGLPVLGAISLAFEQRHRTRHRLAVLSFLLCAIGLVAVFVFAAIGPELPGLPGWSLWSSVWPNA